MRKKNQMIIFDFYVAKEKLQSQKKFLTQQIRFIKHFV